MRARLALIAALSLAGCAPGRTASPTSQIERYAGDKAIAGATQVAFAPSPLPSFFDAPFPSELRRKPDGRVSYDGFEGDKAPLVGSMLRAAGELAGFAQSPTVYFKLVGAPSTRGFPADAAASLRPDASVFLLDVDPASPERGARVPVEVRLYTKSTRYVPAGLVAVKPLTGFVLRPGTAYAAVVKRTAVDDGGALLGVSELFERVKSTEPQASPEVERARMMHAGTFDLLGAQGHGRGTIAAVALFRTDAQPAVVERLVDDARVRAHEPSVKIIDIAPDEQASVPGPDGYDTYVGHHCTPSYQRDLDLAPFVTRGGALSVGPGGAPTPTPLTPASRHFAQACAGHLQARFVLTIPHRRPGPVVPLMVSSHGTFGSARDMLGVDDFAGWAAKAGVAVVSTDQPLHGKSDPAGARPGSRDRISLKVMGVELASVGLKNEMLFYNPFNPQAARGNMMQAIADAEVLLELFAKSDLSPMLPGRDVPRLGGRLLASGHSQGSQSIAALGAHDGRLSHVVLSGSGGDARFGVLKNKEGEQIRMLLEPLVGLEPGELEPFHPAMALLQHLSDGVDPQTSGRGYWGERERGALCNVLHIAGVGDSYNPDESAGALAVALRATPLGKLVKPVPGLTLLGAEAPGASRRAFLQVAPTRGEDGHFVAFREPEVGAAIVSWLGR